MIIHKKGRLFIAVICMVFLSAFGSAFASMNVSAAQLSATNPRSFDEPWERYLSGDNGKASLKYGYNEFAFNEDYAWATHATKNHYASIYNGNGWHTGSNKGANGVSKIEVRHKGSSVSYYCNY